MKFKKLGTTDLDVSLICLGTMTWGTQNTEKDAFEQMDYSLESGINFFDTAELYSVPPNAESYGKTETMIGNWFEKRKNRDKKKAPQQLFFFRLKAPKLHNSTPQMGKPISNQGIQMAHLAKHLCKVFRECILPKIYVRYSDNTSCQTLM